MFSNKFDFLILVGKIKTRGTKRSQNRAGDVASISPSPSIQFAWASGSMLKCQSCTPSRC